MPVQKFVIVCNAKVFTLKSPKVPLYEKHKYISDNSIQKL